MGNARGHQCKVKISGREKKVNENTYDISSMKRVTKAAFDWGIRIFFREGQLVFSQLVTMFFW